MRVQGRGLRGRVVGIVVGAFVLLAAVFVGVPVDPAGAQGGCSVAGRPGSLTTWVSSGSDAVADRVEEEFGVSLAVLEPAFAYEIPVCVDPVGLVGLAGPIVEVASLSAGAFESAAVSDALVLLMAGSYRPEPLLSPARGEVQWAGLESWLAVDSTGFVPIGPVTGSAGGVDVTASAVPVGTVWTFGDGTVVECLGPGELFVAGGPEDAPCGKEWEHTSAVQSHAVQVAVRYDVSWSSSLGGSGALSRVGGSLGAYGLFVDELQAVGVFGERDRPELIGLPSPDVGVTPDCSLVMYASGDCGDPVDPNGGGEVDDGECGALSGPLRDIIAAGGASAEEAIAQIEQWASDLGVTDAASGIRDWLVNRGRDAAGWVNDNVVGHVVDASQWAYAQGAEQLSRFENEIRWVQGAAGELWGVVDGAVVAQAAGVVEGGQILFRGAVAVADAGVQQFKQDIGTLRDGAEILADAVGSTGIGEHLGVGIDIVESAGDVAIAVGECLVWIGAETYNAIPDVLKNLPILGGLSLENMIGCANALGGRVADIAGLVQMVAGAASNPAEAVAEAEAAIKGLIDAVLEDPQGVALQFGKDLSHYHLQEEGKTGQWVGAIACEIAMEVGLAILSGGVYTAARVGTFGPKIARIITRLDDLMPRNVIRRLIGSDGKVDLDVNNQEIRDVLTRCLGRNSFPGESLVAMADGSLMPISQLVIGDEVASFDFDAVRWTTNSVESVWSASHPDRLVTITIADGGITSTDDHLVWNSTDGAWTEADDLIPGDEVLTADGAEVVAATTSNVAGDGTVWDITVANDHNFLVTNQANGPPVLVHNCGEIERITVDGEVVALINRDPVTGRIYARMDQDGTLTEFGDNGTWTRTLPDGTVEYDAVTEVRQLQEALGNGSVERPYNDFGPAESIADAVDRDGNLAVTEPRNNLILRRDGPGPDVDPASAKRFTDLATGLDWKDARAREAYLDGLDELYRDVGTSLDPRLREAIDRYMQSPDASPDGLGGRYPGTHSEILAVNDLLNQGFVPADIRVGTVRLSDAEDFVTCSNCGGILDNLDGLQEQQIFTNPSVDSSPVAGVDGGSILDSNGLTVPQATGNVDTSWGVDEAWLDADGSPRYPSNNGRVAGSETYGVLDQNATFDRYGAAGQPYGGFLSEEGTSSADRAIPPDRPGGYDLYRYEPNPDRPPMPIIESEVAPWFDQPGGGQQIEFDVQRIRDMYGPDGTSPSPEFDQMLNGDRVNLDYWFTITPAE